MHDAVAVVAQAVGESDVRRAVQQHGVAGRGECGHGGDHAAEHAVFVSDRVTGQSGHVVAVALPADDRVEVLVRRIEVAIQRVLRAFDDRLGNGRHRGEIHVGDPHRNHIESLARRVRRHSWYRAQTVHRQGVLAMSVDDGGEIVNHAVSFAIQSFQRPMASGSSTSLRIRIRLPACPLVATCQCISHRRHTPACRRAAPAWSNGFARQKGRKEPPARRIIRRKNHPPEEPFAGRDADTGTPHPRDRE